MFKNMKIRMSLILGFGSSTLVSAIIIIAALFTMNVQQKNFNEVLTNEVRASEIIKECRLDVRNAVVDGFEMLLSTDRSSDAATKSSIESAMNDIDALLTELRGIYPLKDSRLDDYSRQLTEWESIMTQVMNQITAGQTNEAAIVIRNEISPMLSAMTQTAADITNSLEQSKEAVIESNELSSQIAIGAFSAILVLTVIFIMLASTKIIHSITAPTEQVRAALVGFSEGNLSVPVNFEGRNELGEMCNALRKSQHILSSVIADECDLLDKMAGGDFNVHTKDESMYVGELRPMIESLKKIKTKLSTVLVQIRLAADQVSAGSDQVSAGAQALSQGTTQQASSIEDLATTITKISDQIAFSAENAEQNSQFTNSVGVEIQRSNEQMQAMKAAMDEINEKSQAIGKVISTIEDIAFQTNILALNAAVEAAHAGAAGKGFAVVASEVRQLASKSSEASKDTADLIESSIKAVEGGNRIATETAQILEKVVQDSSSIVKTFNEIAEVSRQQADAVAQITQGMDQISSVVQTNSATAEESAAASEELSGQANMLKDLVGQFVLEEGGSSSSSSMNDNFGYQEDAGNFYSSDKY